MEKHLVKNKQKFNKSKLNAFDYSESKSLKVSRRIKNYCNFAANSPFLKKYDKQATIESKGVARTLRTPQSR
jgi:hypothetical protein